MVHCVMVLENSGTSKIRVLPSLSPNLDKENFATASQWCCEQNSSTVELVDWTRGVHGNGEDWDPMGPWDSHGNGSKISHGMGMGWEWELSAWEWELRRGSWKKRCIL